MIRYTLSCDRHHEFESWFTNSSAYDTQVERGLVLCPLCGSARVEKALMTPRLARSATSSDTTRRPAGEPPAEGPAPAGDDAACGLTTTTRERELRARLRALRNHLTQHAENVGPRFSEEARKMHYGEAEHRSIYGVASAKETQALHEEGIPFAALPVLPDDRN